MESAVSEDRVGLAPTGRKIGSKTKGSVFVLSSVPSHIEYGDRFRGLG